MPSSLIFKKKGGFPQLHVILTWKIEGSSGILYYWPIKNKYIFIFFQKLYKMGYIRKENFNFTFLDTLMLSAARVRCPA